MRRDSTGSVAFGPVKTMRTTAWPPGFSSGPKLARNSSGRMAEVTVPMKERVEGWRGVDEDVEGRAGLDDAAVLQHRDAVGDRTHHRHFVGDEQHGEVQFLPDAGDQRQDLLRGLRIERRRRLVAEQHAGMAGERARNADALLLAAGNLGWVAIALLGEPDQFEQFIDARIDLASRQAGDLQRQRDVLSRRAPRQQREMLEHHADRAAGDARLVFLEIGDDAAGDLDPAGGRPAPGR